MKGLEAFAIVKNETRPTHETERYSRFLKAVHQVEKELKALEILKGFDFKFEDYDENNHGSIKASYTKIILDDEEIDLLKEVLK